MKEASGLVRKHYLDRNRTNGKRSGSPVGARNFSGCVVGGGAVHFPAGLCRQAMRWLLTGGAAIASSSDTITPD
jgi:hypothetical protein